MGKHAATIHAIAQFGREQEEAAREAIAKVDGLEAAPVITDEHECANCGRLCHIESPVCYYCAAFNAGLAATPWQ